MHTDVLFHTKGSSFSIQFIAVMTKAFDPDTHYKNIKKTLVC